MRKIILVMLFMIVCVLFISCKKETVSDPSIPPVPLMPTVQQTSKVLFWARPYIYAYWDHEPIIYGDPIKITINNETKSYKALTFFPLTYVPIQCFEDHTTVRFDLPAGRFHWTATRGNAKVTGSITIGINTCITQEIIITH